MGGHFFGEEFFASGNIGYSKIEKVAYVATQETDMIWAHRVETQTQVQLESAVRAERFNREETTLKSNFEPEKMTNLHVGVRNDPGQGVSTGLGKCDPGCRIGENPTIRSAQLSRGFGCSKHPNPR